MKYMITGNINSGGLLRWTLGGSLLFLAFFWVTNALLYFRHMDLSPASVVHYYLGSEADFTMPRTYGAMLEVTHAHLAMMAMVLLLLTHLAVFLSWPRAWRLGLILGAFGSALCGEAAGWLVRFVHPAFAPLKVAAFVGLQVTLAVLLVALAAAVRHGNPANAPRPRSGREDGTQPQPSRVQRPPTPLR